MGRRLGRFGFFLGLALLLGSAGGGAQPGPSPEGGELDQMRVERRIALVIGNGAYGPRIGPLDNPANDARDIAAALTAVGLEVTLGLDLDRDRMRRAIIDFGRALGEGGVGLFYYSGHAFQLQGVNYMVPLGADVVSEWYVPVETVQLDEVLARMGGAENRLNIVILDSCRNNPFKGVVRGASRGLAQTPAPTGTYIAYAAAPDALALDGAGQRNSPYTAALLEALAEPGRKLVEAESPQRDSILVCLNGIIPTPVTQSPVSAAQSHSRDRALTRISKQLHVVRILNQRTLWKAAMNAPLHLLLLSSVPLPLPAHGPALAAQLTTHRAPVSYGPLDDKLTPNPLDSVRHPLRVDNPDSPTTTPSVRFPVAGTPATTLPLPSDETTQMAATNQPSCDFTDAQMFEFYDKQAATFQDYQQKIDTANEFLHPSPGLLTRLLRRILGSQPPTPCSQIDDYQEKIDSLDTIKIGSIPEDLLKVESCVSRRIQDLRELLKASHRAALDVDQRIDDLTTLSANMISTAESMAYLNNKKLRLLKEFRGDKEICGALGSK